jgi:hypothetical protein
MLYYLLNIGLLDVGTKFQYIALLDALTFNVICLLSTIYDALQKRQQVEKQFELGLAGQKTKNRYITMDWINHHFTTYQFSVILFYQMHIYHIVLLIVTLDGYNRVIVIILKFSKKIKEFKGIFKVVGQVGLGLV